MKFIVIKSIDGNLVRINPNWIVSYRSHPERDDLTVINLGLVSIETGYVFVHNGPVEEVDTMIKDLKENNDLRL